MRLPPVVLITAVRTLAGTDRWRGVTILLAGVGISMEVANLYFEDTWPVVSVLIVTLTLVLIVGSVTLLGMLLPRREKVAA